MINSFGLKIGLFVLDKVLRLLINYKPWKKIIPILFYLQATTCVLGDSKLILLRVC